MKKKCRLAQGAQFDINAAFDLGPTDTSVTYEVPSYLQDIISVTSAGLVSALAIGTAEVSVKDAVSGRLLRSITVQVLSQAELEIQDDLDSGARPLEIEILDINSPITVSGVDKSNNLVGITFTNAMAVNNRNFQVGIRAVGSNASSTSSTGRFEFQNGTFSGVGPHTVDLLSAVADGVYEVYVQDLVDLTLGSAQVVINTEDLTPPTAVLSGAWSPYTELITLSWAAADAETGVVSKTLDVRSQDGSSVLINNQNVTADADSTMTALVAPNDKTYVATLTVVNGDGLSKTTTATVVVPPAPNQPYGVTAVDNGNNTITVSWTNSVWVKTHDYQIGLRPAGLYGNTYSAAGLQTYANTTPAEAQITVGPLSYTLDIPFSTLSGTYEIYVWDIQDAKLAYTPVNYVRHDLTAPTIFVNGTWQNDEISISWSANDNESAVSSKVLDVRSADGATVLLDNLNVTSDTDNALTLSCPAGPTSQTFTLTFTAVNAEGLSQTGSVTVNVPQMPNQPHSATAAVNGNLMTISWYNNLLNNHLMQIGLRPAGVYGSAYGSPNINGVWVYDNYEDPAAPVTLGPLQRHLNIPAEVPSGTYELFVWDVVSSRIAYVTVNYVKA